MSQSILELTNVARHFGGVKAVDGLCLKVPREGIFGLMGPNGAGKTTVINLITGFFSPDEGLITFNGADITRKPGYDIALSGITRTYQNVRLFSGMTALEQVIAGRYIRRSSHGLQAVAMLPSERRERREAREAARELLNRVGLDRHDELAENLSYGDQRRVEIARALATEPKLLLLDEPTAGMNVQEANVVGELMQKLSKEGITIFVVEHNMALILERCDQVLVMNFGQALVSGTPRQCVDDPAVQEAYFGRRSDAERVNALRELRSHTSGK